MGYALKAMYYDKCGRKLNRSATVPCAEMETINGTLLYRYLINVTFVDQFQQEISFDTNGDPPAWYIFYSFLFYSHFLS